MESKQHKERRWEWSPRRDRQTKAKGGGECVREGMRKDSGCLFGQVCHNPNPKPDSSNKLLGSECPKLAECREVSKYVSCEFPAFCSQLLGEVTEPRGILLTWCPVWLLSTSVASAMRL
jgi:hypothetical protein